ncbi:MAG: NAD(+)/NADH kinase [Promethearchaeota archaeon]
MDERAIALACRMDSDRALNLTKKIYSYLIKQKKQKVFLETRIAPKIFPLDGKDLNEMTSQNTKFLISVGGDGTLLRVAQGLDQEDSPPIFGVNIGSVGFLDESNERTVLNDLEKVLEGEYIIEKCSKITAYIIKKNAKEIKLNNALNEILIVSSKASKIMQISIKVNGQFLNRSYLDGVIISTSTGSTAYNLSAGGAIVSPRLDTMQITPLNVYARSGLKPIILPIDSEIGIKLLRPRILAKIIIDGQQTIKALQPNTIIKIKKANAHVQFIRLSRSLDENYIKRLRKKIIGTYRGPPINASARTLEE